MKAMKHSTEPKRKKHSLYTPARSQPAETAVFAILGLVALASVAVAVVWGSVPAGSEEEPLAALGRLPMVRYIRSGQLSADARTLAAMVHYVLESERPMATNVSEPNPTQKSLAMPTNNAPGAPRA